MDVVFAVLELLDDFSDQNHDQFRDAVEVSLSQMEVDFHLAVERVKAHIDQTLDLQFAEKVAKRSVLVRLVHPSMTFFGSMLASRHLS